MSKRIEVSSLGYTLTKEVPSSVEEYNGLAPKRENPCLEDATYNTFYRATLPAFRDSVLAELGEQFGVERINHGTEDEPKLETEGKWMARIVAKSGQSREDFLASTTAIAQKHMDAAPFDPSERERSSDGPKVGKRDKDMAEELLKRGEAKVAEVTAQLSTKLGRAVGSDVDSVARALADFRRLKAKEREAQDRAEIGLN